MWRGVSSRGREGGRGVAWGKQQREGGKEGGVWRGVSSRGREGGGREGTQQLFYVTTDIAGLSQTQPQKAQRHTQVHPH